MSSYTPVRRSPRPTHLVASVAVFLGLVSVLQGQDSAKVERTRFADALSSWSLSIDKGFMDKYGYPYDTVEQIVKGTESDYNLIRKISLKMLVQEAGEQARPTVKKAMDDPEVTVRLTAAELLGYLGDASGLPRLQKDLAEWVEKYDKGIHDGNKPPPDPRVRWRRKSTPIEALSIARTLAKFGDNSGFEFAARVALQNSFSGWRRLAVDALVEISRNDRSVLLREKRDPYPVLLSVARTEKDMLVLQSLTTAAVFMPADVKTEIFNAVLSSANAPQKIREDVKRYRQASDRLREQPSKQE